MASHGINVGEVSMDVGKMMEGKNAKVNGLTGGIEFLCKKYQVRVWLSTTSTPPSHSMPIPLPVD